VHSDASPKRSGSDSSTPQFTPQSSYAEPYNRAPADSKGPTVLPSAELSARASLADSFGSVGSSSQQNGSSDRQQPNNLKSVFDDAMESSHVQSSPKKLSETTIEAFDPFYSREASKPDSVAEKAESSDSEPDLVLRPPLCEDGPTNVDATAIEVQFDPVPIEYEVKDGVVMMPPVRLSQIFLSDMEAVIPEDKSKPIDFDPIPIDSPSKTDSQTSPPLTNLPESNAGMESTAEPSQNSFTVSSVDRRISSERTSSAGKSRDLQRLREYYHDGHNGSEPKLAIPRSLTDVPTAPSILTRQASSPYSIAASLLDAPLAGRGSLSVAAQQLLSTSVPDSNMIAALAENTERNNRFPDPIDDTPEKHVLRLNMTNPHSAPRIPGAGEEKHHLRGNPGSKPPSQERLAITPRDSIKVSKRPAVEQLDEMPQAVNMAALSFDGSSQFYTLKPLLLSQDGEERGPYEKWFAFFAIFFSLSFHNFIFAVIDDILDRFSKASKGHQYRVLKRGKIPRYDFFTNARLGFWNDFVHRIEHFAATHASAPLDSVAEE
jgi:hypothetical protein